MLPYQFYKLMPYQNARHAKTTMYNVATCVIKIMDYCTCMMSWTTTAFYKKSTKEHTYSLCLCLCFFKITYCFVWD